jgi:putative tryptophan/tyrosine transport system substrate-binding protein
MWHRSGAVLRIAIAFLIGLGCVSPILYGRNEGFAKLALKYRLPATSIFRLFAETGGTISYGHRLASAYERAAVLVAKVLGGAKPADLPVERPSKFELVLNLTTAKDLGRQSQIPSCTERMR